MYRNVYYDGKKKAVHLWTWDENGKRVRIETSYEPYLYVESSQGTDGRSIFDTPLRKITFENQFERNTFVNETPITRLFHNISCEQDFLLQTFKDDVDKADFSQHPLKVYFLDIETYSTGDFPVPEKAEDPINLITLYDSIEKKYYTWGKKDYKPKSPDVKYFKFHSEVDMIQSFLSFWECDPPDILTGWNSGGFDLPYIMTRLHNILGKEDASRLSPLKNIFYRENIGVDTFGKQINRWYIRGLTHIDYMEAYKTFSRSMIESYKLGFVGQHELGESKIDIGATSLGTLSDTDWEKFVDYNIQDVKLLVRLDEKLKLIKLIRTLSYKGFIPFEQALGKVAMITGAVAHQALRDGQIIPTFKNEHVNVFFEGGYVHDPERGLSKSVVSYDANSLYPNTIISLNISPETKLAKLTDVDGENYTLLLSNGKSVTLEAEKYQRLLEKEKICVSKHNILYTQKFKGVIPKFIDRLYAERVDAKNKMNALQKQIKGVKDKSLIEKAEQAILDLDTLQYSYKIVLNSIYGVFAQKYSPLFDLDNAASITLTGQAVVKEAANIVFSFVQEQNIVCEKKDIYRYGDTDSCYFSIEPILAAKGIQLLENGVITPASRQIIEQIGIHLNEKIQEWAGTELKSYDPRFVFKQEAICDVAVFMEKKRYIMHVLESEGIAPKKPFKYVGVEVQRSTYSEATKKLIKEIIESAILSQDKKMADKIFKEAYETFRKLPVEEISFRMSVRDIQKYSRKIGSDGKIALGTPSHVKGSIYYNNMLKQYGLTTKYEAITNGDKIKKFYTLKNKYNFTTISFLDKFPEEFKPIFGVDITRMFEKAIVPAIERLYNCIGWSLPSITLETHTDLMDLLSN